MIAFRESKRKTYSATKCGSIYSVDKKTGSKRKLVLSIQKTCKWDKVGYLSFGVRINGETKTFRVHQVVAGLFLKNDDPKTKTDVNHIDGNKHNNNVSNLEYVTRSKNMKHAHDMGLISKADISREKNPNFKNTKHHESLIKCGLYLIKNGRGLKYASTRTGISYKLMSSYWTKRHDIWSRQ